MKQIDLREGAKRQHRAISLFCVIQCWVKGLDGLTIRRPELERLLGIVKFKQTRMDWLEEDLKEFFPYQNIAEEFYVNTSGYINYSQMTFSSITISRIDFDAGPKIDLLKLWQLPTRKQLEDLYEGVIPFFADYANYDERLLASYLSLLSQGQISPHTIPPLDTNDDFKPV